ncbi:MAG: helix-turn-helix transcriptional regulator [Anaerolineaceae bacterium]|nr:helix-turn-helix transcriptional regulator [Anaerolineaceae bacterium]
MSPAGKSDRVRNQVRKIRIERHLTQEELGHQVGLTRQSIIAIEKGRFTPSIHTVLMISRALDISTENLFWLADQQEKEK